MTSGTDDKRTGSEDTSDESALVARAAAGDEEAVDAEWQRLQAARIAEEREEAEEDLREAARLRSRPRWPWLALAAALAAGILVTALVNGFRSRRPAEDREVETGSAGSPAAGAGIPEVRGESPR